MDFTVKPLEIPGPLLIEGPLSRDERGFSLSSFLARDFKALGLPAFVQDFHSRSKKGVLRGLHYQKDPAAIGKLVRCASGKIFDVGVDLRRGSAHYAKWAGIELSGKENRMLYVPPGFAHGFCVLSPAADVLYKMTGYFSREHDRGVRWDDPEIGVGWPAREPLLSARDRSAPLLKDADNNFRWRAPASREGARP